MLRCRRNLLRCRRKLLRCRRFFVKKPRLSGKSPSIPHSTPHFSPLLNAHFYNEKRLTPHSLPTHSSMSSAFLKKPINLLRCRRKLFRCRRFFVKKPRLSGKNPSIPTPLPTFPHSEMLIFTMKNDDSPLTPHSLPTHGSMSSVFLKKPINLLRCSRKLLKIPTICSDVVGICFDVVGNC